MFGKTSKRRASTDKDSTSKEKEKKKNTKVSKSSLRSSNTVPNLTLTLPSYDEGSPPLSSASYLASTSSSSSSTSPHFSSSPVTPELSSQPPSVQMTPRSFFPSPSPRLPSFSSIFSRQNSTPIAGNSFSSSSTSLSIEKEINAPSWSFDQLVKRIHFIAKNSKILPDPIELPTLAAHCCRLIAKINPNIESVLSNLASNIGEKVDKEEQLNQKFTQILQKMKDRPIITNTQDTNLRKNLFNTVWYQSQVLFWASQIICPINQNFFKEYTEEDLKEKQEFVNLVTAIKHFFNEILYVIDYTSFDLDQIRKSILSDSTLHVQSRIYCPTDNFGIEKDLIESKIILTESADDIHQLADTLRLVTRKEVKITPAYKELVYQIELLGEDQIGQNCKYTILVVPKKDITQLLYVIDELIFVKTLVRDKIYNANYKEYHTMLNLIGYKNCYIPIERSCLALTEKYYQELLINLLPLCSHIKLNVSLKFQVSLLIEVEFAEKVLNRITANEKKKANIEKLVKKQAKTMPGKAPSDLKYFTTVLCAICDELALHVPKNFSCPSSGAEPPPFETWGLFKFRSGDSTMPPPLPPRDDLDKEEIKEGNEHQDTKSQTEKNVLHFPPPFQPPMPPHCKPDSKSEENKDDKSEVTEPIEDALFSK